jgi:putative peptidoglycan lipid II flippase
VPSTHSAGATTRIRTSKPVDRGGGSFLVALGILGSRLTGLARERFIGQYFGIENVVADALGAAIRIPNLLGNLFGEGVLSAAFVTVYSKLRAQEEDEEAEHVAEAVFGILSLTCAALVLLGVSLTPFLIDVIAPGFKNEAERALTVHLVRILFAATGLSVMSAWCLGVLNSHRRFLLSYLSPVVLNFTVIAALIWLGGTNHADHLAVQTAWAYVVGSIFQFAVQFPRALQVLPGFRPVIEWHSAHVRSVLRNFGPIFLSRGVVQISSYVDQIIASWLPVGAIAIFAKGQVISILPISLFSMSVSAAELPAMSSAVGSGEQIAEYLRKRLSAGLHRIAFFVVPSAVAFLVLGDVIGGAIYEGRKFTHSDVIYLWAVLAGSAVGLLASSLGRLYSSAFYALLDTRTPLRFALVRVTLTTILGLIFAFVLPPALGIDRKWGVAGLTASAGIAGWIEFSLLRRELGRRIGRTPLDPAFLSKLWSVAFLSAALAYMTKLAVGSAHPIRVGLMVLPLYGATYLGGTTLLGIGEAKAAVRLVLRRFDAGR